MKPFCLEKALAGEPVVTEDKRNVTQLCKLFFNDGSFILVGVIEGRSHSSWIPDGMPESDHELMGVTRLFMAEKPKVKREGWVNVYKNIDGLFHSSIYETEEFALECASPKTVIATVKIEWEEEAE